MRKYSIGILLLLASLIPSLSNADSLSASAPVTWNTSGQGSISVQVTSIAGGGTITFNCTVNNVDYVAYNLTPVGGTTAVTTTTTNGIWTGPLGPCNQFKLTIDTGTATVNQRTIQGVKYLPGAGGGGGSGTVTSIATTSPITGGTITSTGTIACATCGVTGTGLQQFAATTSAQLAGVISNETGSSAGLLVFNNSPTIVTPTIASFVNSTHNHQNNAGGGTLTTTALSGLGTDVATALAVNVGSAGAFVTFNGALGTPSSGTLTNATGLPVGAITGFGTGIATFLATPSSANLASALTDETGSGVAVFGTSPTFTTSAIINEAVGSSALTLTGATQTSLFPVISATQTWNNAATTFTGILLNVTNTASNISSRLLDVQTGGSSQFSVTRTGQVTVNSVLAVGSNITLPNSSSNGFIQANSGTTGQLYFADAASTLAQRNSTNAQTFNIYNTYTSSTNNEGFNLLWSSNVIHLGAFKGSGGGTARVMTLDYGGTTTSAISIPITSGDITIGGSVLPTGYKSADGTAGVTVTTCTGFKNGICISGT